MASTTFAERLGYLIFMRHAVAGRAPSWKEIGDGVGVTGEAVMGWARRKDPPPTYAHVKALVEYFVPVAEEWLVAGKGQPPMPDLFNAWDKARVAEAASHAYPTAGGARRMVAEQFTRRTSEQLAADKKKRGGKKTG